MSRGSPLIRVRLTALYAGTIAVLMLASTFALHHALSTALERGFESSASGSLAIARSFFRIEIREFRTVEATLAHISQEVVFPDRRLEFVLPSGGVFVAPPSTRLRPSEPAEELAPPVRVRELPLDPNLAPGWRIRLYVSAADLVALRDRINFWLAISVPTITLLALAAGWWVTGETLRPIGTMARAAERITVDRPAVRLPIANPHDEVGRLGTQFNALLDRLDAAMAQQRRFLADAEHELRTPVARMRNRVDLALLDATGASDRAALEDMSHDLHRTSNLLSELLLLARADAGRQDARRERRFLDDLVVDAITVWHTDAERAGVALTVSQLEEAAVMVEPPLIERLVGILVDNAIRYTPSGGTVDVRVAADDGAVVLEVADTGIGIADDERARLFERFFRGSAARQAAPDGSGLGLSIARWIVERHGGALSLRPRDGGGTLARVSLPRG